MVLAIMGIGLAGSGKSTVLKSLALAHGFTYVSRDDIVEARCGNPHDQSFRSEAGVQAEWNTRMACLSGTSVVLDSTFVELAKRRRQIAFLRIVGALRVVGLFFDVPFALAREQNRSRTFVVSDAVLKRQNEHLTTDPPALEDGFDRIYRIHELETMKRIELGCSDR
jgi:predicted kinase